MAFETLPAGANRYSRKKVGGAVFAWFAASTAVDGEANEQGVKLVLGERGVSRVN